MINNTRQLGDGAKLVKEVISWPETKWSIRKGDLLWSKTEGWKKYFEAKRADSIFKTAEEALTAWENSKG